MSEEKKKVYISGAISGHPMDEVVAKFERKDSELRARGWEPVNPINNGLGKTATWHEHMRADIKMMLDCDAIYMLECWHDSRGANIEYELAHDLGMEIMFD